MRRRSLLLAGVLGGPLARPGLAATPVASALPRRALVFPRDHGAHPELRTEWWYVTGQARTPGAGGREFGFQVTFFRTRVDATQSMQSAFAARQLIFAHAALTDVQGRKLWHDQRIAREGFGAAGADVRDAAITLRDWSLTRRPADGAWLARLPGGDFSLDLVFEPTQPVLLQGDQGLSRKGPDPAAGELLLQPAPAGHPGPHLAEGAAPWRCPARPGWTMSGARPCCTRTPSAGTGSA
jgi:predicted secreted hydrolase